MIDIYHKDTDSCRGIYTNAQGEEFDFHAYPNEDGGWEYWHFDEMSADEFYALHDELLETQQDLNHLLLQEAQQ